LSTSHTLFRNEYPTNKITIDGRSDIVESIAIAPRSPSERVDSTLAVEMAWMAVEKAGANDGDWWRRRQLPGWEVLELEPMRAMRGGGGGGAGGRLRRQ
jgi:hypothetical protein